MCVVSRLEGGVIVPDETFRTYAVQFVVAQFIARRLVVRLLVNHPDLLFCVETGNKLPYYEPLNVQLRKS